ncbi:MAG: hypothetical protein ACLVKO_08985 [Dysgonomonas sp.]
MKKLFFFFLLLPFTFVSCGGDDDSDDPLYEMGRIVLKNGSVSVNSDAKGYKIEARSKYAMSYRSENEFVIAVDSSGVITPVTVGDANVVITSEKDSVRLKVTVNPVATLYPDPYLNWGASRSDVIKNIGKPTVEQSDALVYYTELKGVRNFTYFFLDGALSNVIIAVEKAYISNLNKHLGERYRLFDKNEEAGTFFYGNAFRQEDATLNVNIFTGGSDAILVNYLPAEN